MPHEVRPRRTGAIRTIAIALVALAATPVAAAATPTYATPTHGTSPSPTAIGFETLPPTRVVDTRRGMGSVRLAEGVHTRLQIRGRGGIPGDAATVSANFTVTRSRAGGFLTLWDCAAERPQTAAVNFGAVETVSAASTVSLDANGGICAFATAATDLVVDVHGFHRAGGALGLSPMTPTRLVDTREALGSAGRIAARGTLELQITGTHGITAEARAVALNVAAVDAATDGWVIAYPCGARRPSGVSLTHVRASVTTHLVVSALSADGRVCVYSSAETDLVIDALGSFASSARLTYNPVAPARLLDTRGAAPAASDAGTAGTPVAAGQIVRIRVAGRGGVPSQASALSGRIAVTGADEAGFATAFPCGAVPNTATVNFRRDAAISNGALLPLSPAGELCVVVSTSAHLVIDMAGWWSDGDGDAVPADGPPALAAGTHNDTALAYQGTWAVAPSPGLHLGDNTYSNVSGSTASFRFTGTGFRLYTAKDSRHGVMAVSVDGGPEVDVDLHATARHAALAYERLDLAAGTHTVVLKHTGRKNAGSTDTFVVVDRVDVVGGNGGPAPVDPGPTTTRPTPTPPPSTNPAPTTTPPTTTTRPPTATSSPTPPPTTTTPAPTTTSPPTAPPPTTTPPATPPPPAPRPSGDIAATREQVGPRVARTERAGGRLPCGTYQAVRFTSRVSLAQEGCTYEFTDAEVCFEASAARRTVTVRHSHVTCGWYFEDGSHGGVTIEWSLVTSDCVGLRPQGATNGRVMEVRDSVIVVGGAVTAGGHCETIASFTLSGGLTSNVHITRSRLIAENRWTPGCGVHMCSGYTGITNVTGTDYVFTDVVFGDPAQPMPAWFMIYETGATFIRPRLHPGKAGVWFFPPPTGGELVDPTYL